MNLQINPTEMRKRTEIENNLLKTINCDLKECIEDLEYIYKFFDFLSFNNSNNNQEKLDFGLVELTQIFIDNQVDSKLHNQIVKKIFDNANTIYYAFQYFYLKKSDFMGMNLTGLINGKMETGLGFRNSLKKLPTKLVLKFFPNIYAQIQNYLVDNRTKSDSILDTNPIDKISFYLIKSDQIDWKNKINQVYKNFLIVSDFETKKYFIFGQI